MTKEEEMAEGRTRHDEPCEEGSLRQRFARGAYGLAATGLLAAASGPIFLYARLSRRPVPGLTPGLSQRMGRYTEPLFTASARPRVWMHAVSVGEVRVAHAIFRELSALLPDLGLCVSTGTPAGNQLARSLFAGSARVVYAPLDIPPALRASLSFSRPDVLVFTETELWPGWIWEAQRRGIPVVLANGRLSEKSLKSYLAFGALFRDVLSCVRVFSMSGALDARRMARLSGMPERILINGNAKFDALALRAGGPGRDALRERLGIPPERKVLVCGSTRSGEEQILLASFRKLREGFPGSLLVLAPRHLKRLPPVLEAVRDAGLSFVLWDQATPESLGPADCLVVNTMGDLFSLYAAADLAFCGGSLVPKGGQNVLEPAVWSVPVLFGPHMDDFAESRDLLLAARGGFQVSCAESIVETALGLFSDPIALSAAGKNARSAVLSRRGAAARHAAVIAENFI
ncbi:MAG: glycosyltransferase N-terminal domain-containing protein [Thermodesulfobacteriota bacterium]